MNKEIWRIAFTLCSMYQWHGMYVCLRWNFSSSPRHKTIQVTWFLTTLTTAHTLLPLSSKQHLSATTHPRVNNSKSRANNNEMEKNPEVDRVCICPCMWAEQKRNPYLGCYPLSPPRLIGKVQCTFVSISICKLRLIVTILIFFIAGYVVPFMKLRGRSCLV